MNRRLVVALAFGAALVLAGQAQAFSFLNGDCGCTAAPSCGCAAPSCGCESSCGGGCGHHHALCDWLHACCQRTCCGSSGCESSCGCAAAPSCGIRLSSGCTLDQALVAGTPILTNRPSIPESWPCWP